MSSFDYIITKSVIIVHFHMKIFYDNLLLTQIKQHYKAFKIPF